MSSVQGDFVYDLMRTWAHDPNEWVRRVPTNALMRYGRQHPEKVIALMRELLHDDSRAVRENVCFCLGVIGAERVIALGGAADPQRPRLLLATLREWLSDEDERARWIIAKTLGRSWVKPVLPDALKLLKVLAADPRPRVRAAVVSTIRSLHRYEPDRVATSLVAWRRARNTHIRTVAIQLDVQGYHAP
jgi:HEAT repeat protein